MRDKTCRQCGKEIERSTRPRSAYCSHYCCYTAMNNRRVPDGPTITKLCEVCGTAFKCGHGHRKRNSRYCCGECAQSAKTAAIKKIQYDRSMQIKRKIYTCEHCGKSFQRYNAGPKKYCSIECRIASTKSEQRSCGHCGSSYMAAPKSRSRFCTVDCANMHESQKHEKSRREKEVIKKEAAAKKLSRDRAMCARLLMRYRHTKNAADAARDMRVSETEANRLLKMSQSYRRMRKKISTESKWRKQMSKCKILSRLYPKEKHLCDQMQWRLLECGIRFEREVSVGNDRGRRADFIVHVNDGMVLVEAKNTSHTSDVDCCMGQALVRAVSVNAKPMCVFPSDVDIGDTARQSAATLGVLIADENNFIEVSRNAV